MVLRLRNVFQKQNLAQAVNTISKNRPEFTEGWFFCFRDFSVYNNVLLWHMI